MSKRVKKRTIRSRTRAKTRSSDNHTELAEARHRRGLRLRATFGHRVPGIGCRFLNRDAVGLGGHGQIELHGGVLVPRNSDAVTHDGPAPFYHPLMPPPLQQESAEASKFSDLLKRLPQRERERGGKG